MVDALGGEIRITTEQIRNADIAGKVVVIAPTEDGISVTLQDEENVSEYIENQEAYARGDSADESA